MSEGVLPKTDLPLRLFAASMPPAKKGDARVAVALEVRANRSPLVDVDGMIRDVLKYEVWAVDLKKKRAIRTVAREAQVQIESRHATGGLSETVTYQVQTSLALPPGRFQLRASAMSAKLQTGGSVYLETEVPDFGSENLELGGLVLAYAGGPSIPIVPSPAIKGLLPFDPTLDREFARDETLRVMCEVARRAKVGADVVVELLSESGQALRTIETRHVAAQQGTTLDVTVPLRELVPASYRLRVRATDGTTSRQREVGFIVR